MFSIFFPISCITNSYFIPVFLDFCFSYFVSCVKFHHLYSLSQFVCPLIVSIQGKNKKTISTPEFILMFCVYFKHFYTYYYLSYLFYNFFLRKKNENGNICMCILKSVFLNLLFSIFLFVCLIFVFVYLYIYISNENLCICVSRA